MNSRSWSILLLTAALSGSSFFFIKLAVESISPLTLAAGRAGIAAIVVYFFMRASGHRLPTLGTDWIPLCVLGVLTAAIPYAATAFGQVLINSSLGGMLFATIPVFSVLIAPLFLNEELLTRDRLVGVGTGFVGVVLIIGPDALRGIGTQVSGAAITLVAALSYAVGSIYARMQVRSSPTVLAAGQLTVASLVLAILSILFESPWTLVPTKLAVLSLFSVAVFSTAITGLLFFWLVRNAGATNTSLLAFFIPVTAVILGTAALGESVTWPALSGFGLILLGAATVTGKLKMFGRRLGKSQIRQLETRNNRFHQATRGDRNEV